MRTYAARRTATSEQPAIIGPNSGADDLRIEVSTPSDWSTKQKELFADLAADTDLRAVKVMYRGRARLLPWLSAAGDPRTVWLRRRYSRRMERSLFDEEKWSVID